MTLVTLSTDIGQQDYIVPALKGQLISNAPQAQIIDITHYLSQSNLPEAAYLCSNAFSYYPANTIHIVLLNFFEIARPHVLITKHNDQYIICADNGWLTMLLEKTPSEVYALPINTKQTFLQITQQISKAVAHICNGKPLEEIAQQTTDIIVKHPLKPTASENWIKGQIIFIDNFENVVINITKSFFEEHRKGRSFKIAFKRNETIEALSNNYLSIHEGEKLAWFNSAGYLEIAINKGNMAGLFGLQGFNEIMYKEGKAMQNKWFYQTITVFFE